MIINGAGSSIGAYAVQLAKRAGLFIVAIAGSSKDYVKSLGADVVIDYREHKGDDLARNLSPLKAFVGSLTFTIDQSDCRGLQRPPNLSRLRWRHGKRLDSPTCEGHCPDVSR